MDARCKAFDCKYAAFTCPDHLNIDNISPELKFWLGKNNISVPTAVETDSDDVNAVEFPTDAVPKMPNANCFTIEKENGKPPLVNYEESSEAVKEVTVGNNIPFEDFYYYVLRKYGHEFQNSRRDQCKSTNPLCCQDNDAVDGRTGVLCCSLGRDRKSGC